MSELKLRHILEPKTPNEWQLRWRMLSLLEERGVCAVSFERGMGAHVDSLAQLAYHSG